MAEHSTIEWTEASWNPIAGCSVKSPGCIRCYAMKRVAPRLAKNPSTPHYAGTVAPSKTGPVFTGVVNLASGRVLTAPLRWKKPRMIFVNSTSDLFHENVPDEWIDRIFAVMALCWSSHSPSRLRRSTPLGHTFQVLTKRSDRMRAYMNDEETPGRIALAAYELWAQHLAPGDKGNLFVMLRHDDDPDIELHEWPLPNVWLGVSAERQKEADERVPDLLATPAAVRFVSAEPLIGPISFRYIDQGINALSSSTGPNLDWIIVGGESGADARPMHPDWARQIRDDCEQAGVPFFFKQWGSWLPGQNDVYEGAGARRRVAHWQDGGWGPRDVSRGLASRNYVMWEPDGTAHQGGTRIGRYFEVAAWAQRVGKKRAGRLLDGVEHNGMPRAAEVPAL